MLWLREISPLHYYTTLPERLKSSRTTNPSLQYGRNILMRHHYIYKHFFSRTQNYRFTMTYKPWNENTTEDILFWASTCDSASKAAINSIVLHHIRDNCLQQSDYYQDSYYCRWCPEWSDEDHSREVARRHDSCPYRPSLFTHTVFSLACGHGAESATYAPVSALYFDKTFDLFACYTFGAALSSAPYFGSRAPYSETSWKPCSYNDETTNSLQNSMFKLTPMLLLTPGTQHNLQLTPGCLIEEIRYSTVNFWCFYICAPLGW